MRYLWFIHDETPESKPREGQWLVGLDLARDDAVMVFGEVPSSYDGAVTFYFDPPPEPMGVLTNWTLPMLSRDRFKEGLGHTLF